jgi:hypothetical protein
MSMNEYHRIMLATLLRINARHGEGYLYFPGNDT